MALFHELHNRRIGHPHPHCLSFDRNNLSKADQDIPEVLEGTFWGSRYFIRYCTVAWWNHVEDIIVSVAWQTCSSNEENRKHQFALCN